MFVETLAITAVTSAVVQFGASAEAVADALRITAAVPSAAAVARPSDCIAGFMRLHQSSVPVYELRLMFACNHIVRDNQVHGSR
ncbi:hypothetical protein [Mycobacterium sp. DL99]|uniref:hypothetical protein n=1 Tax=Mycobacterium sp. DL99 TaxID=2528957 RepID=UPI002570626C|nr:hypothetical protein [Mycobacterium sp. DL99]